MNVVDIHPEELIDKLAEGSLTFAERKRLDAHLAQCSSCRFEMAVRGDLVVDALAFEERPALTLPGAVRQERALSAPREGATRQARSLRPRSRRRWPLMMLAAALVLCAGGAMAAVIRGAVVSRWLPWSAGPERGESSARVSATKPVPKAKRVVAGPAPTIEPIASSAVPIASIVAARAPEAAAVPTPVTVALARARSQLAAPDPARGVSVGAPAPVTAVPAASNLVEASATRAASAALFADANRARRDGNIDRAVGLYRALQSRYPNSSETELSRAMLAQLQLERGNPEAALAGFDHYLAADSPILGAEALVGRARALEQLGKSAQAAAAWRQVQSRFPGSVHARLAATRLAALGMR